MPRLLHSRKVKFNAALVRCGLTQRDWLKKYGDGKSRTHLYLTLKDEKQSKKFARQIDAFIAEVDQALGIAS